MRKKVECQPIRQLKRKSRIVKYGRAEMALSSVFSQ